MINKINKMIPCVFVLTLILLCAPPAMWAQSSSIDAYNSESRDFPGFGVVVKIDQPEYYTDFMPPGSQPPEILMSLKVFNDSRITVTFDFTTSQRFDFAIYNSTGIEVWRWSADKEFLQVLGQITLKPGESVTYKTSHRFVDEDEKPMPEDLYTLEGELTATDFKLWVPRTMSGKVSFWHQYVY